MEDEVESRVALISSGVWCSPVNDLLDRGDYTLSEIFDEDDLLQVREVNGSRPCSGVEADGGVWVHGRRFPL